MTTEPTPLPVAEGADVEIRIAGAPAGAYVAHLRALDRDEWKDEETGEVVPRYVWSWLADVDGQSTTIEQRTSRATGPRSHVYMILSALVGSAAIQPAATFRASELIGREAVLTMEVVEGRSRVAAVTAVPKSKR